MKDFRDYEGNKWVQASNKEWERRKQQYEGEASGCILAGLGACLVFGSGLNIYERFFKEGEGDLLKMGAVALAGLGAIVLGAYFAKKSDARR